MNKKIISGLALSAIVLLSSCKKLDKYFPGHGNSKKNCRITEIQQSLDDNGAARTGKFYYSNKRLLDSVIFDISTGSSGAQFYYFTYDNNKRLIEYRAYYSRAEDDYYFIHKYVYNGNKIIRDTAFVREAGSFVTVNSLHYDGYGRVVKEDVLLIEADGEPTNLPQEPLVYVYDAEGNLELPGSPNYDNKVSYLRTNESLMFTQRNYSLNNVATASGYNSSGLPLGFSAGNTPGTFLQWSPPTLIKYHCK